ncbi:MAG: ATP-binding protein [Halomonas sp.]|uniref:sensor histidine kinase n=1 Tax=Halomonas sp. TaxID=1486246 RepID=UPI003F8E353E
MKGVNHRIFGVILPLAVVPVFALLLTFSLIRMFDIEKDMRTEAEQNMLWVLHQAEVAALRLGETAALAALGEAQQSEVSLRYDILASRMALLGDGPQRRFIEHIGFDSGYARLARALDGIAPLVVDFTAADSQQLREQLVPFSRFFGRAANAAMITEWDELGGRLESYRHQLRQIITFLIGIMVAGAILAVSLAAALRQTRQRNRMLRRERDFSSLLISSSGEGILAVDRNGRCTLWNSAMVGMLGKSAEQAVGRPLKNVAGFFDTHALRRGVTRALDGEISQLTLRPLFQPDCESARYVDLRFFPMRNEGVVMGAILLLHDATDRHAAQQKDAKDRDRLEELVVERTRDLDSALQREKSAADLYRNFAAMVSHQFRTPLAVADSALQRLIRRGARAAPDEVVERASRAREAVAGLTRLVESTLDAARLDAGQVGARRVACHLGDLVEAVSARQRGAIPDRQIRVQHAADNSCKALCDPAHVEQVLENLLSNAVKYSPPEMPVTVILGQEKQVLLCDVYSVGVQIGEQDQAHLFERNYRGANSVGVAGTGIGLFMARTLARMQGGEVSFHSYSEGVFFRVTLPCAGDEHSFHSGDLP